MNAQRFIHAIDQISYWSGKAFAWLIVALTFVVSIEVFKRYILNAPTAWIFDFNNMLYGTLFMMCGAYTLAQAGHVRADFVYLYMKPRGQAALDLTLYLLFFIPCMLGLIYAGGGFALRLLADRRALHRHRGGAAGLPLQDGDPARGRAGHAAGAGRDRPLRRVPPHRRVAARAWRTSRRSTSSTPSSATASTWTRSRAGPPWRARRRSTRPRATGA